MSEISLSPQSSKENFTRFLGYFIGATVSISLLTLSNIFINTDPNKFKDNYVLIVSLAFVTFIYFLDDTIQLHQINAQHPYDWNKSFRRLLSDVFIVIFFYFSLAALNTNSLVMYKTFVFLAFFFSFVWADKLKDEVPFDQRELHFASAYKFLYGFFSIILLLCLFGSAQIKCDPNNKILASLINISDFFGNDGIFLIIFCAFYLLHDISLIIFKCYKSEGAIDFPLGFLSRIVLQVIEKFGQNNRR